MFKLLPLILSAPLLATAFLSPAIANEPLIVPGPCWMEDEQGRILDLVNLCGGYGTLSESAGDRSADGSRVSSLSDGISGAIDADISSPRRVVSTVEGMEGFWVELVRASENGAGRSGDVIGRIERSTGGGGSSGGSGSCNSPNDRASDGSRCGGRAAQVRPGGR